MCVCVFGRETERERECVCVCLRKREIVCVCVWERQKERDNVCVREREREFVCLCCVDECLCVLCECVYVCMRTDICGLSDFDRWLVFLFNRLFCPIFHIKTITWFQPSFMTHAKDKNNNCFSFRMWW